MVCCDAIRIKRFVETLLVSYSGCILFNAENVSSSINVSSIFVLVTTGLGSSFDVIDVIDVIDEEPIERTISGK